MQPSDFTTASFRENPYPFYERSRSEGPFAKLAPGILWTGQHSLVRRLVDDRRMGRGYLPYIATLYGEEAVKQPVFQALSRMFLLMNPPAHTRPRNLLVKAFNGRKIESMRQLVQETADRLLDAFPAGGEAVDLVQAYALPLPAQIICGLLDLPPQTALELGAAAAQLSYAFESAMLDPETLSATNAATEELERFFSKVVDERRAHPGNDLISLLIAAEENGEQLDQSEIVSNVILLFFAGHETTSNMLGNALIALYRNPDQLSQLRANPTLMQQAMIECLRYDSSVQLASRVALEDIDIDGVTVSRDTVVFLSLGAANRDPARFLEPEKLWIERQDADNRSLAFGGGIHYCMGARLALLELEIAVQRLFERFPNLRLTHLEELHWRPRNTIRGVETLLARL
jgi:cytochrome P450